MKGELQQIRDEHHRRRFDWMRVQGHYVPETMLSLERPVHAADLMLDGLRQYYLESLTMNRIESWRKAAHAMVDLMADVDAAVIVRRGTLPQC
jgi:hypothetical protein